jgi:hypothetical protein
MNDDLEVAPGALQARISCDHLARLTDEVQPGKGWTEHSEKLDELIQDVLRAIAFSPADECRCGGSDAVLRRHGVRAEIRSLEARAPWGGS